MVVPMIKYSFLLLKNEHEKFLDSLRELGVVDITINDYSPSDVERETVNEITEYQQLNTTLLTLLADSKESATKTPTGSMSADGIKEAYNTLTQQITEAKERLINLQIDANSAIMWGEYNNSDIALLKENGLNLRYFQTNIKNFNDELLSQYTAFEINKIGKEVYFVVVERECDEQLVDIPNCKELDAPTAPYNKISTEIDSETKNISSLKERLVDTAIEHKTIEQHINSLKDDLQYAQIRNSNSMVLEDNLVYIEGWSPEENQQQLTSYFENECDVVFFKDKPTIDDEPPVLLKNSKFARSAEMITRLYSLPKYNEVDMTPFLAPFFIFFVGLCIGDNGYGLILFLGALFAKTKMKDKEMQSTLDLAMYCGISTIIMGSITGVCFGLEMAKMTIFEPIKDLFIPSNDMFGISMAIGLIHILYAITLRSIIKMKRYGVLYGISGLGWVLTIVGSVAAYALPMAGLEWFNFNSIAYYIVMAIAFIMMLFFQDPRKNILMNFGMGIWELYNNITGLLGDVLSYLRLFALGLTGGVIAGVFNELAVGMSGDIPVVKYIIMILLLLVGHGINIFISFIGAFVHPLRLTFVEFYKNVEFGGGGKPFTPFKRKTN